MKLKHMLLTSITALTVVVRGTNAVACTIPVCLPNPFNCHQGDHGDHRSDSGDSKDQPKPPKDNGDKGDGGDHGRR